MIWSVLVWHITWSVNSVTHLWGYRNYETPDNSRNNILIGLLSGGEGWHNINVGEDLPWDGQMTGKIFINYRRGDDAGFTQALHLRLESEFTADDLFMDVEGHIRTSSLAAGQS